MKEDKKKILPEERFIIQGIQNAKKQVEDFWNTIDSSKVNRNILKDEDVFIAEGFGISLIVIKVPRADYKMRPIYVGENPYKGTFKRNNEGDYHATEHEKQSAESAERQETLLSERQKLILACMELGIGKYE